MNFLNNSEDKGKRWYQGVLEVVLCIVLSPLLFLLFALVIVIHVVVDIFPILLAMAIILFIPAMIFLIIRGIL